MPKTQGRSDYHAMTNDHNIRPNRQQYYCNTAATLQDNHCHNEEFGTAWTGDDEGGGVELCYYQPFSTMRFCTMHMVNATTRAPTGDKHPVAHIEHGNTPSSTICRVRDWIRPYITMPGKFLLLIFKLR